MNGGAFHGREPDERRTDLDLGRLDSYALQVAFLRGRWSGQVSSAWLTRPERLSTYDAVRRTASVSYESRDGDRSLAWTVAAGQNREVHGSAAGYPPATTRSAKFGPSRSTTGGGPGGTSQLDQHGRVKRRSWMARCVILDARRRGTPPAAGCSSAPQHVGRRGSRARTGSRRNAA